MLVVTTTVYLLQILDPSQTALFSITDLQGKTPP